MCDFNGKEQPDTIHRHKYTKRLDEEQYPLLVDNLIAYV